LTGPSLENGIPRKKGQLVLNVTLLTAEFDKPFHLRAGHHHVPLGGRFRGARGGLPPHLKIVF
jgi:hypothetical protein